MEIRKRKKPGKSIQYDWSSLANSGICNKYMVTIRNKFDPLQETSERHTPNDKYENFVSAYLKATAECTLFLELNVKFSGSQ